MQVGSVRLVTRASGAGLAVLLRVAVLPFLTEDENPREIVTALRWRMAAGSYIALSHVAADGASELAMGEITQAYEGATAPAVPWTEPVIRDLFAGLDLTEPGLTDAAQWRSGTPGDASGIRMLAGAGRKPRDLPHRTAEDHASARMPPDAGRGTRGGAAG